MKNKPEQTTIESLNHDGKGVTRINGKTIFIRNALPGEEVIFNRTKKRSKFDEGEATTILKESPNRTTPKCEHYDMCGGCSLQHLDHQTQLSFKTQSVLNQLKHIGNIDIKQPTQPQIKIGNKYIDCKIITGPTYSYRSKARLSVKYVQKKQKMLVGFHEKNGRFIAETEKCSILHPTIGEKISEIANLISELSIYQFIPQIEVACGDNINALVLRNLKNFSEKDITKINDFGDKNNIHFYSQSGGPDTVKAIFTQKNIKPLDSSLYYELPCHNIRIYFEPTDFTQINRDINRKLVNHTIELLDPQPDDTILDLFCGIGNFTLPIAKKCKHIVGVEGAATSIARAKQNSIYNKIENAEFYCYDLTKDLTSQDCSKQNFNKILLDPPRTGALEICEKIKIFNPKKIIYVSCNPATLARDAKQLMSNGYEPETITLLDMYPHTSHIEVIISFK